MTTTATAGWILAMDTAADAVSAAVIETAGGEAEEAISREPHQHTEMLLPLVDGLLKEKGLKLADAAAIAFSAGPGAFAGVRTACAAAQGLAWAVEKPVVAVPTLAAAALLLLKLYPEARRVMPVLDARMKECYVQVFERGAEGAMPAAVTEARNVAPEDVAAIAAGNAVEAAGGSGLVVYEAARAALSIPVAAPLAVTAAVVAEAARRLFLSGDVTTAALASPIYVRNRVALTIEERRRGERL